LQNPSSVMGWSKLSLGFGIGSWASGEREDRPVSL
jgi:hypothetical protein